MQQQFDFIIAGFPFQAAMITPLARARETALIYDAHNVEADRFRKMRRPLIAKVVGVAERLICNSANLVLTVSENDQTLLNREYETTSAIVANGVDTGAFSPGTAASQTLKTLRLREGDYLLFFGGYDYPPNVEAARFLLENVWPTTTKALPALKLVLAGRCPHKWMHGHHNVVVTGAVDDLQSLIRGARIILAPLFSGGGTRLKIIEALACGKNVLSTPFGALGITDNDSPALRLSKPSAFTDTLISMIKDTADDNLCGNTQARELANRFDWTHVIAQSWPTMVAASKASQVSRT